MENTLFFKNPADQFIQAQPIGNGTYGAMVYGGIGEDKISFNHDTLWSGSCLKPTAPNREVETYKKVQELVLLGDEKIAEAENMLIDNFFGCDSQAYMPMCYIKINSSQKEFSDYQRTLDMERGLVDVSCKYDEGVLEKQYFISYPDNCFAMKITSEKILDYSFSFFSEHKFNVDVKNGIIVLSGECPSQNPAKYKGNKEDLFNGEGMNFACAFYFETDGKISFDGDSMTVNYAHDLKVYSCASTSFVSFDKKADKDVYNCIDEVIVVAKKGYDTLLKVHVEDFSKMYNRTILDLDSEECTLACDERLKENEKPIALYEQLFNFGKYLIISGSRDKNSQALGLQGIWNEEFAPPWNAAYTININFEMCYWPMLMCGYTECALPIIEQLKKISITGRDVAKKYFNADGYAGFHNSDIWGFSTPPGKNDRKYGCGYGYWSMAAGWLCRHAYEHYEYTQSIDVLEEIYPLLKGAVEFFLSILTEYGGKMIISPSTSPENFYIIDDRVSALGKWTTMTQSIVIELFTNFLNASELLKQDKEISKKIVDIIPKLDTFEIGSNGQLLEWDKENTEWEPHHRHVSHLYGLYPGELFTKEKRPDLYEACRKSLELRGDNGTGWSLAWKANLWAGLKDGNKALFFIDKQLRFTEFMKSDLNDRGGSYPNLFCAHPPFQIDGNFGATAAIARLFLQCEDERIKLLPALPDKLKKGRISGLIAKRNVKTDISWENGKLQKCIFYSEKDNDISIEYNGKIEIINIKAGIPYIYKAIV